MELTKHMVGKLRLRDMLKAWSFKVSFDALVKGYDELEKDYDELDKLNDELQAKYDELEKRHEFLVKTVPQLVEFDELKETCIGWKNAFEGAIAKTELWKARAEKAEKELAEKIVRNPFGCKGKPKKLRKPKSTAPGSPRRLSPRADGKRPERGTPPKKKRTSRLKWGQNRVTKFTALGELKPLPEYCQPKKAGRMSYGEYMAR